MFSRMFLVMIASLLTVSCSAQTDKPANYDEDCELPLSVQWNNGKNTGPGFRDAVNVALRKTGRRVLVIFEESNSTNCPVEVRTIDTVCRSDAYGSIDPSVVCRRASVENNPDPNQLDKIIWRGEEADDVFKISFDGASPCKGTWPSRNFKRIHTCELKEANELGIDSGKAGYFKYNILSPDTTNTNPECDLDPHFIVRD